MTVLTREPMTAPRGLAVAVRPVLAAGDVREQRTSTLVLAEALRHAAELRLPGGGDIPGPTAIGIDALGRVEIVMPDMPGVLAWQKLLIEPRILYVDPWSITITGTREGWDWIVRTVAR